MSYISISIKDAMEKINTEWFLPAIQRPYVWGSRYNSERYICKLFDSLYKKYPIGALIFWETDNTVAHREFLRDYHQGDIYKNVDEGVWCRHKNLVYDGQQRLQTLYSCLKYTFNDRILVFDLAYNRETDFDGETGFRFIDKSDNPKPTEIRMNQLFVLDPGKTTKRNLRGDKSVGLSDELSALVEDNVDILWSIFVEREVKALAYFPVKSNNEDDVNDVFERLNTGGLPLSKSDLLFSKIKAKYYDFEAELMEWSNKLKARTKLAFSSYDILQLIHLIVRKQSRINENISNAEIEDFYNVWKELPTALNSFFDDYMCAHFHISHISITRYKNPLLVLLVFFYTLYKNGGKYLKLTEDVIKALDKFFITSQLNGWDLQSYTDNFAKIILKNTNTNSFPKDEIFDYVKYRGNREIAIKETVFRNNLWFSLKITFPHRDFEFDYSMANRFNPELDHIFPRNLAGMNDEYKDDVDIIWNMQPIKGAINLDKSNHHPKLFFTDTTDNGKQLTGKKYYGDYDCIPEMTSTDWDDYKVFIKNRRTKMIEQIKKLYDITLVPETTSTAD
jgi:uncharacterized protein with ParB-like and HNH nuclease domain